MKAKKIMVAVAGACMLALVAGCGGESPEQLETAGPSPEWTRFRGPEGSGISTEQGLPVHWDETGAGVRWRAETTSASVSSPIVSGWQVFLTGETEAGDDISLEVQSYDLKTGELLWQTTVVTRKREDFPSRSVNNTSAGPSPVTDGELVYAYFGTHLAALDFDGAVVWLNEVDPLYLKEVYYGAASSPILTPTSVIVHRDREKVEPEVVGWLAAFDKKTGNRLWRKKWTDTCCSYTTPVLLEHQAGIEILVGQAGRLASFDAETGKRLWDVPQKVNQPVASPVMEGEIICSASGGHGVKQLTCWHARTNQKGKTRVTELWKSPKGVSSMATPVLYNGLLFTVGDGGVMYCFDPRTGRAFWRNRLGARVHSASLVAGDGKIYAVAGEGLVSVVAASKKFQLLAENGLPSGNVVASPAIVDGCLLVRTADSLLCIEGTEPPEASEPAA